MKHFTKTEEIIELRRTNHERCLWESAIDITELADFLTQLFGFNPFESDD